MYDIKWLKDNYPKEYACLPEAYRENDCLEFYITECGNVRCQPRKDQIEFLGDWQMGHCTIHGEDIWIMSPRITPVYNVKID